MSTPTPERNRWVSDSCQEFLMTELLRYVEEASLPPPPTTTITATSSSSTTTAARKNKSKVKNNDDKENDTNQVVVENEKSNDIQEEEQPQQTREEKGEEGDQPQEEPTEEKEEGEEEGEEEEEDEEASRVYARERSGAKMERMGYSVGFRLSERLSQYRTFNPPPAGKDVTQAMAAAQLEAVKFLCKEIWMEVFQKQIDKLQTNHRGVFVLKDLELRWLTRIPSQSELSRVTAIQLMAFPCGIIRGVLSNLGIATLVTCDFMADGQNMAACSFNIKIK